jgi:hypothetical protein
LFSDILHVSFPYAAKSRKAAGRTPKIGRKPRKSSTTTFLWSVSGFKLFVLFQERALRLPRETTIDMNNNKDDLKDVQPYPLELWPETRPAVGRSSSGEQLHPYQVAVVLGRGKPAKIEVALTKWEEYQVKLMGEQLRKEGACRGLDIRAAKFVSGLSEFQASEFQTKDRMLQWIEEVLAGQRLQKAERAKKAKAARERRRWEGTGRREGNSPLSRRGGPIGD